MYPARRTVIVAVAALSGTALSSCSLPGRLLGRPAGASSGGPTPVSDGPDTTPPPGPSQTPWQQALSRVPLRESVPSRIAFSYDGHLAHLPDDQWQGVRGIGARGRSAYDQQLREGLGIDLLGASSILSVGEGTKMITLVLGQQDPAMVMQEASSHGWTGDQVLTREADPDRPWTADAVHLCTVNEEGVAFGGPEADLTGIGDPDVSLLDDPSIGALALALRPAEAGIMNLGGVRPGAVGVAAEMGVKTIVCAIDDDPQGRAEEIVRAVEEDTNPAGIPYSTFFTDAEIDSATYEGPAQVWLTNAPDADAGTGIALALNHALPGLEE